VVRAVVLYEREPEGERYQRHVDEFASKVPCNAFRHGRAIGSPFGAPPFAYYAEFEWSDSDAFKAATRTDEFMASGKDAMEMGIPFTVTFVDCE
jgi:hypothetical protein